MSVSVIAMLRIDLETLAQATTDGLTALALVVARQTGRDGVVAHLERYRAALLSSGKNDAGAALVAEMARVVRAIPDHD